MSSPYIEVFCCCRVGLFVRIFTLAQYARARSTLEGCEIFGVRLFGSLRGGGVAGSLRDGGGDGAEFSAFPDGNNGDNLTNPTDKAVS